jgi:membrane protein implicated in regulation of membrane protease activity
MEGHVVRILGAVMVGSAFAGIGLLMIGLFIVKPQGPVFEYYAVQLVACVVNLGIAALIWRYAVRRRQRPDSHGENRPWRRSRGRPG